MDEGELSEIVQDTFAELVSVNPQHAMAIACGMLVGLIEYQAQLQGADASREITIETDGNGRNITIHAKG